ncbi:hypothetical protein VST7929_01989 [Vibrio stylophorae]|uniref:DUF2802 domain-containing protein n=1 Tax=Vibrio stylophorae TaxID=659351 RepID=A0ABN8DW49_9VIBR|nr:DUF2802 domain-containing protein [Vibrio stylophorae]CAH0534088.1 hypothetical protein VST7929_01989 [Vibrio stylophorae]
MAILDYLAYITLAITICTFLYAVVAIAMERRARQKLEQKFQNAEILLRAFRKQNDSITKQFNELRTGVISMSQKVTQLAQEMQEIEARQQDAQRNDPEGRLYSRASKMVQLGADIEELMTECELPKAEAELLMNLQKRMRNS